jgi:PAS domain S-box-containing protein
MKFYFKSWVLLGFLIALAIIIWLGVTSFLNNRKFAETSKLVSHTNKVLFHVEQVLALVMEMESNQRAFALVSEEVFLQPIKPAADTLRSHLKYLAWLIRDNPNQQKRFELLEKTVEKKIAFISSVVEARKVGLEPAIKLVQSKQGKVLMEQVKEVITAMQKDEYQLLQQRITLTEIRFHRFNNTFIALLAATAIIIILVFVAIHYSFEARLRDEQALQVASNEIKDLYENSPCGYYSLDENGIFVNINHTLLSWLQLDKGDVLHKLKFSDIISPETLPTFEMNFPRFKQSGFISNLEFEFVKKNGTAFPVILNSSAITNDKGKFIKSRSTVFDITETKDAENKIKQLNKELEAFTYSISHDLRSPLRSIEGYTKILEEDYDSKLDIEGKRLMQVIVNNTKRMGELIDKLLDFSRIGRKDLIKTSFNTENMIKTIISEQLEHEPDRDINFEIQQLPMAYGDLTMMREVWGNLISNAIKFTRKVKSASIEIGSFWERNEVAFYIKDNGVGFDMNYSQKLFGVFQRLHKITDFEGTGVGLAIVYRIITRHGGRVWADSKLNEGATFTLTLPISHD